MAVDYLNALNVGSGLQTNDIIDAIVEAERAPKESAITTAKEKLVVIVWSMLTHPLFSKIITFGKTQLV